MKPTRQPDHVVRHWMCGHPRRSTGTHPGVRRTRRATCQLTPETLSPQQQARTHNMRIVVAALLDVAAGLAFLLVLHASLWQVLLPWYDGALALSVWILQGVVFYWVFSAGKGSKA